MDVHEQILAVLSDPGGLAAWKNFNFWSVNTDLDYLKVASDGDNDQLPVAVPSTTPYIDVREVNKAPDHKPRMDGEEEGPSIAVRTVPSYDAREIPRNLDGSQNSRDRKDTSSEQGKNWSSSTVKSRK